MSYSATRVMISVLLVMAAAILPFSADAASSPFGRTAATPKVEYSSPPDDSVMDLTGRDKLVFSWKEVPIPGGGREAYRFTLFKGFTYEVVMDREIGPRTFSTEVPAEKFEDGTTYTWRVKQRDSRTLIWSRYDTWSFKVVKREAQSRS